MIGAVAGRHHVVENPLRDAPLTVGIPLPSAAELKFLHQLPQTRLGTSNRKRPWELGLARAAPEARAMGCWEVSRASEAGHKRARGRIGEMPQDQQGAPPPPWDNLVGPLAAAPVLDRQCFDNNGP